MLPGVRKEHVLANIGYMAVLPIEEIRTSRLVAADVAEKVIGRPGVVFVSVTVMISTFGPLNGSLFTSPRIFYAMADEGMLFQRFRNVHPRFNTPHLAILMTAILGIIFVMAIASATTLLIQVAPKSMCEA